MLDTQDTTTDAPIASGGVSWLARIASVTLMVLTLLFMAYTAFFCFQIGLTDIEAYDGSYNAMVSRTFAFQGRYGVWDNGRFVPCPVEVSTGPVMLLPLAAAYKCLGDSPFLPNLASTIYCFGVLFFVWFLALRSMEERFTWHVFSLLVAIITLNTLIAKHGYFKLLWAPLGDVLAGLFLIASTISLGRLLQTGRNAVFWGSLGGVLAAAAFNTKFLVILPLAVLCAFLLLSTFLRWIPRTGFACWLIASAAVEFCFELFTLMQMGSLRAYLDHWKEFKEYFQRAGSGLKASKPPWSQLLAEHGKLFFNELSWSGVALLLLMLLAFFSMYRLIRRKGSRDGWIGMACAVQIVPILLWWFGYADRVDSRHVIPVLVLLPFCCHFLISDIAIRVKSVFGWMAILALWPGLLILGCALSPVGTWMLPHTVKLPLERTVALQEFGRQVDLLRNEHPNARFWGAGWWRHWDVQLVSSISCLNLLEPPPGDRPGAGMHDYVIESDLFNLEHDPVTMAFLEQSRKNPICSISIFHLYQLQLAIAGRAVSSASHENHRLSRDVLAALNDGVEPSRSADGTIPRFTWWDHCGTQEWVQYDFKEPTLVSRVEVYWYDDTGVGACRTPCSWRLLVKEGELWRPVEGAKSFGCKADVFNRVDFQPLTTTGLRLEVQLQPGFSGGILEWKVE